jgi:hypothetical protein
MATPRAERPHMPGYGTAAASAGLLPWSWAETRLRESHDFWLATVTPAGRPHLMPVWAVWTGEVVWFSSSRRSVKARNVAAGWDDLLIVTDAEPLRSFLDAMNAKYATAYGEDFLDPGANASMRLRPEKAFGLREKDFTGTPTRWTFP